MDFDNSWTASFQPGKATNFFDITNLERPQLDFEGYSIINALWLAELSRLIYKQESDEIGPKATSKSRSSILKTVSLEETDFFNSGITQCSIMKSTLDAQFAVLVFRGTHQLSEWITNLNGYPMLKWPKGGFVHRGFAKALDNVWDTLSNSLSSIQYPIFFTGHSFGGALSILAASRSDTTPHAVYTFGTPPIGNADFVNSLKGFKIFRVVNSIDVVVRLSSIFPGQIHVGELHLLGETTLQSYNLSTQNQSACPNEAKLHSYSDIRKWYYPPQFVADHAPINYVAKLEKTYSRKY